MILASKFKFIVVDCGYYLNEEDLGLLNEFFDSKKLKTITQQDLLGGLNFLKEQQLMNDHENETDEYLDTFVALGGQADKEGVIQKSSLITIIKSEFELTIDMEDYLKTIGGDDDDINYFQFCMLLDAGTSGNPSRLSSYFSKAGSQILEKVMKSSFFK